MAREALHPGDGWDEAIDGSQMFPQPFYQGRYLADHGSPIRREEPSRESLESMEELLSLQETVTLFRNAVYNARQAMQQSLMGSEKIGEAIQLKLTIDLNRQRIQTVPSEVSRIMNKDVERLVLSHNQISQLHYNFEECSALTFLNLRGNLFKEVPKAIFKLPKLQILDLSRNKLSRLPEEMKTLKSLRVLSVMNNKLEKIPLSLGFLESLRIFKLAGNPLEEGLKNIVNGRDGSPSPLIVPLVDNEKDAIVLTIKVKQYLKAEAAALESGGESSSESPLDTPRPLKRNTSLRFPVVPATSGSESAPDLKSPGLYKPAVPFRSHYRVTSGQKSALQNASFRRPGIAPLVIGNDRNRSNSESILQATQNTKAKRMGVMPGRTPELGTLDEIRTNRNSHHFRGFSHASVLREKHVNGVRSAGSNSTYSPVKQIDGERYRGIFIRRLSSLPEDKRESKPLGDTGEGIRGMLYSLNLIYPHIGSLLHVLRESASKPSSLQRVYDNFGTHLDQLDKELYTYDPDAIKSHRRLQSSAKSNRKVCRSCIQAYRQLVEMLLRSLARLTTNVDPRYVRTLLLAIYGSSVETRNACVLLDKSSVRRKYLKLRKLPVPFNHEGSLALTVRSITPTKERPNPITRLMPSEATITSGRIYNHAKSKPNPQSAVPLYINGRSRSNSRTNALPFSASSSVANTPKSGESFLIPGTPVTFESSGLALPPIDQSPDAVFERIYLSLSSSVDHGLTAVPQVRSHFTRNLESGQSTYAGSEIAELWTNLINRCRSCLDMCEAFKDRLSTVKLNEPEVRSSAEFWRSFIRYADSFVKLVDEVKAARRYQVISPDVTRLLAPVHKSVKNALQSVNTSPWSHTIHQTPPLHHTTGQSQWGQNGHGRNYSGGRSNGHYRNRGGSGSNSSPYMTSVPATPLSAALGPAAQATIPSTPASASSLDRSFQGDVFQRADSYLNMQNTLLHRR